MFTIFHFGFELLKIAVQSAVYTILILSLRFLMLSLSGYKPLFNNNIKSTYICIAATLLIFSFTYFGDHGLGDEAIIPIGHFETMEASDGYAYFAANRDQIHVDSFEVKDDHLCMSADTSYYDYQLKSGVLKRFNNKKLYNAYASTHQLPLAAGFKKFWPQYQSYWNGWRFWVFP